MRWGSGGGGRWAGGEGVLGVGGEDIVGGEDTDGQREQSRGLICGKVKEKAAERWRDQLDSIRFGSIIKLSPQPKRRVAQLPKRP